MTYSLLPTKHNVKTITDLREDTKNLISKLEKKEQYYIFYKNEPKGVMLSITKYQEIMEMLEELEERISVQELDENDLKKSDYIGYQEYKKGR